MKRAFVTTVIGIVMGLGAQTALAGFSGTDVFLPSVGAKPGTPPSVWYTTVWVHNPNATAANVTFYLLERQANLAPITFADTIQAGDTRKYDDAVQLMFNRQTFGAIRVTSNVKVVAGSRIYSQSGALKDSVGQYFAGTPASFAIGVGQSTELVGVYGTLPPADSTFRYNYGFVETTGTGTCDVKVTVKDPTGAPLGNKTYPVRQWEQVQKSFTSEFPALSTPNARLTVEVISGSGKVIAFGSNVANGSQDPSTFEMAFRDDLLAENVSGGSITGVTAGAGLSGGGASGTVTLNVGAGDGITVAADTVGIANNGVTSAKIASGEVVKSVNGLKDAVTLTAGANVTITPSGQTLTIAATPGGGGGDITGVTAGTGLAGGGTSGDVTLGIEVYGVGPNQLANGAVSSAKLAPPISISAGTTGSVLNAENTGSGTGVRGESVGNGVGGRCNGSNAAGVFGVTGQMSSYGVYGKHEGTGYGVYGVSLLHGVHGETTGTGTTSYGVWGDGGSKTGVGGASTSGYGVLGRSTSGTGVRGESTGGTGVYGQTGGSAWGVYGVNTSKSAYGILGHFSSGVYGGQSSGSYAGYFSGNVHVTGTLSKGGGSFKIDHPLDPANQYLYHSFVESPDMMNIYNGNVVTDDDGLAVVELPEWFETLNRDFRYQLTVIGRFAQAIVEKEIAGNRFVIRTNLGQVKVSWLVTGIRQDAWANAHRIPVEQDKPVEERGHYLHPDLYGQPAESGMDAVYLVGPGGSLK